MKFVSVEVNGIHQELEVDDWITLADFLRNNLGLTGTKLGCEYGSCGACSVLVDGGSVRSCLELAVRCEGKSITTVEGLDSEGVLSPIQVAFSKNHGLQCGYCTAGFLMTAQEYVQQNSSDDEKKIREHLSGNLCRCTGYQGIVDAVIEVVVNKRKEINNA
jgi:carbon-monoxide dehydrogenase small subunit